MLSADDIQQGWLSITLDAEQPTSTFEARIYCPIVWISVKPDWRDKVKNFGLHMLPKLEIGPAAWWDPVFILDADDDVWVRNGVNTTKAIWSTGGRTKHEGYLVWQGKYWSNGGVRLWAVSTTEERALRRLVATEAAMQATEKQDAAALKADMNLLADFEKN